jgi:glycosyltransferase involved in cell wall biosynthesis
MLSILIPTYNYNVVPLVETLVSQSNGSGIEYEIIILDDASTDTVISDQNKTALEQYDSVQYILANKNKGRERTRQKLANLANYHWLLFLDSDTLPKRNDFIDSYINAIDEDTKLIFGGIAYSVELPPITEILRWNYGKSREEISVKKRVKNKYLTINSGGFLIDKKTFLDINSLITWGNYGLDILFTYNLLKNEIPVKHIDNPVYHLGLEPNQEYLIKSKKAVETLYFLQKQRLLSNSYSSLQKMNNRLKRFRMNGVFRVLIEGFIPMIEKRLTTKKTSLLLFDLYRLYYFTELND